MYDDKGKNTEIDALSNIGAKSRRVGSGIRSISEKGIKIVRKKDKNNLQQANKKITPKSVTKSIGKNIGQGAIRINGRLIEEAHSYKNDDSTPGLNAVLSAGVKTKRLVETSIDTFNTAKTGYKVSKKAADIGKKAAKSIGKFLAKLIVSNPLVLIVLVICIIIIIISGNLDEDDDEILTMFTGLGTEVIMTEQKTIDSYKELLANLDKELNNSINSADYSSYDDVQISGSADTSLKEILSLLAVIKEQEIEFNNENSNSFKSIHNKMYEIETNVSSYTCEGCYCPHTKDENCPGNCECIGHERIEINIIQYSLEEMLDILGFDDEQKDWARRLLDKDYNEIYENFE